MVHKGGEREGVREEEGVSTLWVYTHWYEGDLQVEIVSYNCAPDLQKNRHKGKEEGREGRERTRNETDNTVATIL